MISTKGRYSIRILLDLAEHRNGSYIPMKDVAARQNISLKYIERLMPALKAAGLVDSVHGIGGRLPADPGTGPVYPVGNSAAGGRGSGPGSLLTKRRGPLRTGCGLPHSVCLGRLL